MSDLVRIRRALISVSDKSGIVAFARDLALQGVEIVSTGGTARALKDAGLTIRTIDSLTGFPEMMDGRVKTLHPKVHGGILAVRGNAEHESAMAAHGIEPIDLVCVNLYPFADTIAREDCTRDEAIENIDIGGPAMVRSASKNHEHVAIVTHPRQYGPVLAEMNITDGCVSRDLRRQLAAAAFRHTADYDDAIAKYLHADPGAERSTPSQDAAGMGAAGTPSPLTPHASRLTLDTSRLTPHAFPPELHLRFTLRSTLRYGENPHQSAAVYIDPAHTGPSVITARQLHGKDLSFNNLHDANAALDLALALGEQAPGQSAACVVKHANPCGAAVASSPLAAVEAAIAGDPLAAFGGILALAGTLDEPAAQRLCGKDIFLEVLIANRLTATALDALKARWQNLRILELGDTASTHTPASPPRTYKPIRGGLLLQDADTLAPNPATWQHRAGPAPTQSQLHAAAAIETIVRAMNSNAVALGVATATGVALVGAGLGQVDRVSACKLAVAKAGPRAAGSIAVSDAFFPFADGPTILIDAGIKVIVHTGGSKRDQETSDLCNARGITCLTTGVRRFKH